MKSKIIHLTREALYQLLALLLAITYYFLSKIEFDFSNIFFNGFDLHNIYQEIKGLNILNDFILYISAIIVNVSIRFLVDDAFTSTLLSPLIFLDKNFTDFLHTKSSVFVLMSIFLSIPFSIELSFYRRNHLSFLIPFFFSIIICSFSIKSKTPSVMPYIFLGINLIKFMFGPTPTVPHKTLLLLSQLFITLIFFSIIPRFLSRLHERILCDGIDIANDIVTRKRIGLLFDYYAYGDNIRLFFVMLLFVLISINNKHSHVASFVYAAVASLVCPQCTNGVRTQEIIIFHLKAYMFLALCVQLAETRSKREIVAMCVMALVESNPRIGEVERKIF